MAATDSSLPIARRSAWRDDCMEVVCGIANAGGGRLVLDADVDGRGVVKRKTNRLMKTIPSAVAAALGLTCAMELVLEEGRMCLEVVVPLHLSPSATMARSTCTRTASIPFSTTRPWIASFSRRRKPI